MTQIILLHGLGGHPWSFYPLQYYLNYLNYNTTIIEYPSKKLDFQECMDHVNLELLKHFNKETELILIGQSMGGVVANSLHKYDWNIKLAIYIGSPLHGAYFISQCESILPTRISKYMYCKLYEYLRDKDYDEPPPHKYHTITMGWFNSKFDGCVYKNEAMFDDENNTHLAWADHRTIFANPRLWFTVGDIIKTII